jgi:dCTP deaminase
MYLHNNDIKELIASNDLVIRPFLDDIEQIGQLTIDFRLGTDFLVSTQGRESIIDTSYRDSKDGLSKFFFLPTRRKMGQEFIFYPNQTVLCSSLEYIKLPDNVFATLSMRSSYSRLGLSVSTIVQAGYYGCISIEISNSNNNPVKIAVGTRLFQARLFQLNEKLNYNERPRKYLCQVRPEPSKIEDDKELVYLKKIAEL